MTRWRARVAALAPLALTALPSCHPPVTQLVVVIDTTLDPASIDEIVVYVQSPSDFDGALTARASDTMITPGARPFPMTQTLVPDGTVTGELTVRVVAQWHHAVVVERDARVAFRQNTSLMVPMLLRSQCQGIECDADSTCGETGCHPPEIAMPAGFPGCAPWTSACADDAGTATTCSTDIRSDRDHCGSCGVACSNDAGCAMGYCQNAAAVQIAAGGAHTCAVLAAGNVACWGANDSFQLGAQRGTGNSGRAVEVAGLAHNVVQVAAGASHTCALMLGGSVWCWGDDAHGQLGQDSLGPPRATPVRVMGFGASHASRIVAGGDQTCAIVSAEATAPGALYCWGDNTNGQMQLPATQMTAYMPTLMNVGGLPVADVAVGDSHICAVDTLGVLRCWGNNLSGQLGVPTPINSTTALVPAGLPAGRVTDVSAGTQFTCAVVAAQVYCWGADQHRQLGVASPPMAPVAVANSGPVASVSAGGDHACALLANQTVECWGSNETYQLGSGSHMMNDVAMPAPVAYTPIAPDLVQVAAGFNHACALRAYGGVVCWGADDSGELGDSGTTKRSHPTIVLGLP